MYVGMNVLLSRWIPHGWVGGLVGLKAPLSLQVQRSRCAVTAEGGQKLDEVQQHEKL